MAAPNELITFDGVAIDPTTDYDAMLDARDPWQVAAELEQLSRRSNWPLVVSTRRAGLAFTVRVFLAAGATMTDAEFEAAVIGLFDPNDNPEGLRYLHRYREDGTTEVRIGCYVAGITRFTEGVIGYAVDLFAPKGQWEGATASEPYTSAADPASVDNNGNRPVSPSITLTTSTHVTRKRFTVVGAGTGGGLRQYPVKFDITDAAFTTTNGFVFVNGVSVPFFAIGGASGYVWARIDTASNGVTATTVDIVYGAALAGVNPLANTMDTGGLQMASALTTNTNWRWNDWSVSGKPALPGAWRPAVSGGDGGAGGSFELTTDTGTSVVFTRYTDSTGAGDADSMILDLGGGSASGTLTNVTRTTANHTSGVRSFVRYRTAASIRDATAWSATSDGTATGSITVTNAVQIAIGVEYTNATPTTAASLTLGSASLWILAMNSPTVTLVATANLDYYDGAVTVGGRTITFTDFVTEDGTLTIEEGDDGWVMTSSVAGYRFYGLSNRLTFSDPERVAVLEPGTTATSHSLGGTAALTISHRDGWS